MQVYLTRVWCIFEQFKATELKTKITLILPPDQDDDLKAELTKGKSGLDEVKDNLSKIDAETAKASVEQDAVTVKRQIRDGPGFDKVNASVRTSIITWCKEVFGTLLDN